MVEGGWVENVLHGQEFDFLVSVEIKANTFKSVFDWFVVYAKHLNRVQSVFLFY